MRTEFRVSGLPPKKDGANSMWGKPHEVVRIQELRRAARAAIPERSHYARNITLGLELHLPVADMARVGDLDNFITGVCDGLQRAAGAGWQAHRWQGEGWESIQPGDTVAIENDAHVVSISAQKLVDETGPWYRVRLDGET